MLECVCAHARSTIHSKFPKQSSYYALPDILSSLLLICLTVPLGNNTLAQTMFISAILSPSRVFYKQESRPDGNPALRLLQKDATATQSQKALILMFTFSRYAIISKISNSASWSAGRQVSLELCWGRACQTNRGSKKGDENHTRRRQKAAVKQEHDPEWKEPR